MPIAAGLGCGEQREGADNEGRKWVWKEAVRVDRGEREMDGKLGAEITKYMRHGILRIEGKR